MASKSQNKKTTSYNIKVIVMVLTLIFVTPIGIILMWVWVKGQNGLKILITLIVLALMLLAYGVTSSDNIPSKQLASANNSVRLSGINQILNAINKYKADHNNELPESITNTPGIKTVPIPISSTGADICADLVTSYITSLPEDPLERNGQMGITNCSDYDTGYTIMMDDQGGITISAPKSELYEKIEVTQ